MIDTHTKLMSCRTDLLFQKPFFGTLAVQLNLIKKDDIQSVATDGKNLFYSSSFIDGRTRDDLVFILAHEVMHIALEHHVRQQHRDLKRWNCACDFVVNLLLMKDGFTIPKEAYFDFKYDGMDAEEVYDLLDGKLPPPPKNTPQPNHFSNDMPDPGLCGGVIPASMSYDATALSTASSLAKIQVKQASMIAAAHDKGTADKSVITQLTAPKVDWRAVLHEFIDESTTRDYSWSRPNRRYLSSGLYLPGTVTDGIPHLIICVDVSGSIDLDAFNSFSSEIKAAFYEGAVDKVTVIYSDIDIKAVETFETGEDLVFNPRGGGGTSFVSTFQWIEENAHDASAIVYFTDLKVHQFGREPTLPVLWAVYGPSNSFKKKADKAPFGNAISLH